MDPATDPVARALADAANKASITYQAGSGEAAPASLAATGSTQILRTHTTTPTPPPSFFFLTEKPRFDISCFLVVSDILRNTYGVVPHKLYANPG